MARTIDETVRLCTENYINSLDPDNIPNPADLEAELVTIVKNSVMQENANRPKGDRLTVPQKLTPYQIAELLLFSRHILNIQCGGDDADPEYDLLAVYADSGPDEGIYVTDEKAIKRMALDICCTLSAKDLADVIEMLKLKAPRKPRTMDRDLIAVNNGIFDYKAKQLNPFSHEYIFMAKSGVDYNPAATNPIIHNDADDTDWDVESWMSELSDDPEIIELLWEIMSAVIRPFVRWNKSAWFYSTKGNNGKGTLCELMRNLCGGKGRAVSIKLSDFGRDFRLEPLLSANSIIVDENDVGTYIDKAADLKAIITNDVISVNRKHKTPITYQFFGFMVQCLNEYPRIKDKTDSFYRRQLFVPFDRCFTGAERRYIKDDYMNRTEVLEYVLYKVLHMNFYELSEPASCREALEDYKGYNDPVRQFLDEILPELVWDFVPFAFLYDLYCAWAGKNCPSGTLQGRNTFINDLLNLIDSYDGWTSPGRRQPVRPGKKMDKPELLIAQWDLRDWMSPTYTGRDLNQLCRPKLKATYNGILRESVGSDDDEDVENEEE